MAAMTLDDVVAHLKENRKMIEDDVESQILTAELQEKTNQILTTFVKKFDAWFDRETADRLQAKNRGLATEDSGPKVVPKSAADDGGSGVGMFAKGMAAIIATALGAYGLANFKDVKAFFKTGFIKPLEGIMNKATTKMDKIFKFENFKNSLKGWTQGFIDKLKLKFALGKMEFKSSNFGQGIMKLWENAKQKFAAVSGKFLKLKIWFNKNVFGPLDDMLKSITGDKKDAKQGKVGKMLEKMKGQFATLRGWVSKVLGIIGKVLTPIAVIFSGIDGLKESTKQLEEAEKDPEKDNVNKTIETIGGFIAGFTGSFIGGFVDAIKNGILWVIKKIFPGLVDEKTGEFNTDTFISRFLKNLNEFSAAQMMTDAINTVFETISKVYSWIRDKIMDFADKVGLGGLVMSKEEEQAQAMKEKGFYSEEEQKALDTMREKGILGKNAAMLTEDQIETKSRIASNLIDGMSERKLRMLLRKRKAYDSDLQSRLGEDNKPAMAGKMRALKEEQDQAGNVAGKGPQGSFQWISPTIDNSNNSTQNVQSKSITVPPAPAGSGNSIYTDPGDGF